VTASKSVKALSIGWTTTWPLMPRICPGARAKTIHHGHHDNERGDPKQDADERETRDDEMNASLRRGRR
jgi:hypothetical protein